MLKISHMVGAIFLLTVVSGCATNELAVRPLESVITHAAKEAKAAGADKLKFELQLVYGIKAGGTVPIPFVPVGLSASRTETSKVTIEINKLADWAPRKGADDKAIEEAIEKDIEEADKMYVLDLKTMNASPIK